ncbi:RNA-directed DNA polymerase, eukaryota [Tanacetum coccineum]
MTTTWKILFGVKPGGVEQVQLDSLTEVVRSINLVSSADRWIWNLESSGEFSVASARKKIDEIRFPIVKDATRWVKCVPIKVNILAWKIRNDALPTRFNISGRGMDIQSISCPICENGVESSEHLFFKCYLIREIGCKIASWWNINNVKVNSYEEWKTWLISCRMESKLKQMFEGVWYSLWWHIWSYRNKILFDDNIPMKAIIFDNVCLLKSMEAFVIQEVVGRCVHRRSYQNKVPSLSDSIVFNKNPDQSESIGNLNKIRMGVHQLFASIARFDRKQNSQPNQSHQKQSNNTKPHETGHASHTTGGRSYASVLNGKEGTQKPVLAGPITKNITLENSDLLELSDTSSVVLAKIAGNWGETVFVDEDADENIANGRVRVHEFANWVPDFASLDNISQHDYE